MLKPMTPAQKQLAEDHMDLVPKIIRSMIQGFPLTSEQRQELCQIGYLALCRAASPAGKGSPSLHTLQLPSVMPFMTPGVTKSGEKIFSARCRKTCWMLCRPCRLATVEQEAMPDAAPLALKDTAAGAYLETLKASQCSTIQKALRPSASSLRVTRPRSCPLTTRCLPTISGPGRAKPADFYSRMQRCALCYPER